MKFRKKPVVVEAFKWDGVNVNALATWAAHADFESKRARGVSAPARQEINLPIDFVVEERGYRVEVRTKEGVMVASPGDWIICGVHGEFYPCKPDIFDATYKGADEAARFAVWLDGRGWLVAAERDANGFIRVADRLQGATRFATEDEARAELEAVERLDGGPYVHLSECGSVVTL